MAENSNDQLVQAKARLAEFLKKQRSEEHTSELQSH